MSTTLAQYTEALTEKLKTVIAAFKKKENDPQLETLFAKWEKQLAEMQASAAEGETVSVALLGGTGAGKSTLINTLLGEDLLPTHSFRTCTSAAVEISYAPTKLIAVQLEFISPESWEAEKQAFLDEIKESRESGQNLLGQQDFIYKAWSLYKPQEGPPPLPFPLDEMIRLLEKPLPENLQKYLNEGIHLSRYRSAEQLKQELTAILTAQGQIWPLLKRVQIRGPFEILKGGLQLVDLPGLNDPNPAREQITRAYLKQAGFIWLAFNLTRGLTRDVMELLKDRGFLTQVIMDGTLSALAFIGTRADEFIPELEKQQLGLPAEASLEQVLSARQEQIQARIREQLSELTLWFSHRYRVQSQIGDVLQLIGQTLEHSPVFVVSALEEQRLRGWREGQGLLENQAQTGIAPLQNYMEEIVSNQGLQARKKLIRSQCQQMNQEIKRLLQGLKGRKSLQSVAEIHTQGLENAFGQARQTLETGLQQIREKLEKRQAEAKTILLGHFSNYLQESKQELPELISTWGSHSWQILQRTVRNQGFYTSPSTGSQLNLPQELGDFVLGGLAPVWNAYFIQNIETEPDLLLNQLLELLKHFAESFQNLPQSDEALLTEVKQRLAEINRSCSEILSEQALQTGLRLQEDLKQSRRKLAELLLNQTEKELKAACALAKEHTGAGLKQQILSTLQNHLEAGWESLEHESNQEIAKQLETLTHHLQLYLEIMSAVLRENAQMISTLLPKQA